MTLLDISIVNVAVPSIEKGLRAGPSELQWVLSGYALTFGLMLVPAGRFGDARGRRTVFVVGLAAFTATSAAAGLAQSALWLVVARLVQGAAAGVVIPQVSGLIQQLFSGDERGRPFGLLGTTVGASTAVGPPLGGLLIHLAGVEEGWRWIFFVNVPVGIVTAAVGWRLLPRRPTGTGGAESLDPVGGLLLGVGVVALLLPLVQHQWGSPLRWLLIPAALVVLRWFVSWERRYQRHAQPLFDLALFGRRSYSLGSLIGLFHFAGFTAVPFTFTLYLQQGLGHSALLAGFALMPFALGTAIAAPFGGWMINRFGRSVVAAGLVVTVAGLGGLLVVVHLAPGHGTPLAAAGPLLVAGIGSGLVITPNQTLTLSEVPVPEAGSAAGMLQTAQRLGSALGIAVIGSVFFSTVATGGGWSLAFQDGLLVTLGFVVAGVIAIGVDRLVPGHERSRRR